MDYLVMFREIFVRMGMLMLLTYFLLSACILFILFLRKEMPEEDKIVLKTFAAGLIGISILLLLKQLFPEFTEYNSPSGVKCIIAGNLIQLIIPVKLYYIQRIFRGVPGFVTSVSIIFAALILNMSLLLFYSHLQINNIPVVFYVILVLFLVSIGFQGYMAATLANGRSRGFESGLLSRGGDNLFFIVVSSLSGIFLIMTAFEANPVSREVVKFSLYLINISLMLKIIYPYTFENYSTSLVLSGIPERSISLNDKNFYEEKKSQELRDRLVDYFEQDKPYLRQKLAIKEVALHLYSNKTYLSRVINDYYCNNFNQFVNYYRVEEAKKMFNANEELSIHKLCTLSGFGSMATFTIAFRIFVGKSPAEWCKEQKIKNFNEKKKKRQG
jgi:AraC-like DNA-binding protein